MKKWILLSISVTCFAIFTNVWAGSSDNQAAQQVIENWFAAMKNNQVDQASSYLAPQFTSIHTDGMVRDREQEIDLIKNLHMKKFHLTDFRFVQSDNTMVVTYKDKGQEKIDNKSIGTQTAGRMAVLQKQDDKWMILAYANLDSIPS